MRTPAQLTAIVLCSAAAVWALDPARKLWHYGYSQWQDADGLPQNTVRAIAQTTDGYLWVGTEAGLARFNGREFTIFDRASVPELHSATISTLLAARDGGLWIGTANGLVRYESGQFRRFGREDGLRNELVRALAFDRLGGLWIGTDRGVVLWDGVRSSRRWTEADGLPHNAVRSLLMDGDDLWIGTAEGVGRWTAGRIAPGPAALPRDTVRALLRDRAGRFWIGMEASGLHCFDSGRYSRPMTKSVRTLLEDRDGSIWIGTVGGGLRRWSATRVETLRRSEGLPSDHIRSLFEDAEGSLWVGTEAGGIAQLRNSRVVTYGTQDGLRSDFIRAVRGDALGRLWVGTEGAGLHRWTGDAFAAVDAGGVRDAFVTALIPDRAGNLWIGTEGAGAVRTGPSGRLFVSTAQGLSANSVWAAEEDASGAVWLGTSNGLVRVKGDAQRTWRTGEGLRATSLRALHAASDGWLWLGFRSPGIQRMRDEKFESVTLPPEAREVVVNAFEGEVDGKLWVATSGGLLRYDGRRNWRLFTARDGLAQEHLFSVVDDHTGNLWFSGLKGIFSVPKAEFAEVLAGRRTRVNSQALTLADGLRTMECSTDAHPAAWRTPDGDLWFATIRGLVRVKPGARRQLPQAPPVVIENVLVNGGPASLPGPVVSPPGNRLFTVRFAALTYLSPEATRYRYRLQGRDGDWVEVAGRGEAVYHAVGPGTYRFEVMAAHPGGSWPSAAAVVDLEVEPYFWEWPWFYAMLCAVVFGALAVAYQRKTASMQREFQAVLRERARIAREIHDTLLQGFAGAALQLGSIRKRLRRDPAAAEQQLDRVLDQVDACLAEAREEIVELRGENAPGAPLMDRLHSVASQAAGSLRLDIETRGIPRPLPSGTEKNLLRIAREAVGNASRHAQARTVRLRLLYAEDRVSLVAEDDGIGMDADRQVPGHFGLQGMRERAEEVGGEFHLQSERAIGTRIEVVVPTGRSE